MNRAIAWTLFHLIIVSITWAAFEDISANAPRASLANISSQSAENIPGHYLNPAYLVQLRNTTLSLGYVNLFGLKDLQVAQISFSSQVKGIPFQIMAKQFGNNLYRESQLSFGSGYRWNETLRIGCTLNYYTLQIQNYRNKGWVTLSFGMLLELSPQISVGILHRNPLIFKIKSSDREIPQILNAGAVVKVLPSLSVFMELNKDTSFPLSIRTALFYQYSKMLILTAGYESEIGRFSIGIGMHRKLLWLTSALQIHKDLPATLVSSLAICF